MTMAVESEVLLPNRTSSEGSTVQETARSNSDGPNAMMCIKGCFKSWWRKLVIIMAPLIFLPIPLIIQTQAAYAFYAISIISVYWITEAIPLAATSLLPMILFPALGISSAADIAINYLNDTNMLFVGGLMVAVAVEKWNLHKRIALLVLLCVSSKPKWLLFGFMSVTAFLSMWISNTATAAMMLPIAHAVLDELKEQSILERTSAGRQQHKDCADTSANNQSANENVTLTAKYVRNHDKVTLDVDSPLKEEETLDLEAEVNVENDKAKEQDKDNTDTNTTYTMNKTFNRLCKGLTLGVAYSANIGGTGTLTGTGPNLVLSGDMNKLFPTSGGIDFGLWFVFAVPAMMLSLSVSWVYLSVIFCDDFLQRFKVKVLNISHQGFSSSGTKKVLKREYRKLGPWKFAEIQVLVLFLVLALLWLFRQPRFMPGWGEVFKTDTSSNQSYFSDSSTAMFIVFLLFVLPSDFFLSYNQRKIAIKKINGNKTLLDWNTVQHKLPWNVIILLGSGFAIADAAEVSGLSCWIGSKLLIIEPLPDVIKAFVVSISVACITEVISNVATTTLFLPILAQLAIKLYINPLYLMIPATVSASYAFMLPVATPPNAIAFSFGYLKVYDMVLTGILMNILCIFIVNLAINTWGVPLFDLHSFPNWTTTNTTTANNCEL